MGYAGVIASGNLTHHLHSQASIFAGFFAKRFPAFRDRLISDHRFLFKVVAEVLIDSGRSSASSKTRTTHHLSAIATAIDFCDSLRVAWL